MKTRWSPLCFAVIITLMIAGPRGLRAAPRDPVYESSQVMEVSAAQGRTKLSANSAALANCTLFAAGVSRAGSSSSDVPMTLYRTDGTRNGTFALGSLPVTSEIHISGGAGWFMAGYVGVYGGGYISDEWLCRSDGTVSGTEAVVSLDREPDFERKGALRVSGGTVFCLCRKGLWGDLFLFTHHIATRTTTFLTLPFDGVIDFEVDGDAVYLNRGDSGLYRAAWDGTSLGTPVLWAPQVRLQALTNGWLFYLKSEDLAGGQKWTIKKTRGARDAEIADAGVVLVRSSTAFNGAALSILAAVNGRIYCNVIGKPEYPESTGLWVSDGTEAGTRRLVAQPAQSFAIVEGGRIAMTCGTTENSEALWDFWVTDGNEVQLVKERIPRARVTPVSGGVLLQEWRYEGTRDLWTSDLRPGSLRKAATTLAYESSSNGNAVSLHNGAAVFLVYTRETGHEPWIMDNIHDQPRLLKNMGSEGPPGVTLYGEAGGRLLCHVGSRLYSIGGTGAPMVVRDPIGPEGGESVTANGYCFFSVFQGSLTADLLFRSDGTAAGTRQLDAPGVADLRAAGNRVYIFTGQSLRMTDTTATTNFSTSLGVWCTPVGQRENGSTVYLTDGGKLWQAREDGTVYRVGAPETPAGDVLIYQSSESGLNDYEPWRTDGTAAGTYRLVDANPGAESSQMSEVVRVGTEWWFITTAGTGLPSKLWSTDGTVAGTRLLTDMPPGAFPSLGTIGGMYTPSPVTGAGGRIFFRSSQGGSQGLYWSSDGTEAGTRPLGPGAPGQIAWQGRLFYNGFSDATGNELWTSDGTEAGTYAVEDLAPGPDSTNPASLTVAGDRLYYKTSVPQGDTGLTMAQLRAVDAVPATTLAAWAAEAGLTGAAGEPQANPAGDGVPNLLKYAFNLNPKTVDRREMLPGGTAGLPHVAAASVKGMDTVDITFLKRVGGGLKYTVERSGTRLQAWEPVAGAARDTVVAPGWESCTVSVARDTAVGFFRVAVTFSGE